ncbi:MAG: DUF4129 domain-containing protein [Candidatus Polarisedimenticolia bacterium]
MDLERVQARIRPRRPWEAVDLGFAMVAAWRGPVYRPWLGAALPVMLLLASLGWRHPFVASLILWWLKPLLDRIPLHVLSHALFGDVPTWRSVLRMLPRLWGRSLASALIARRFDAARSFTMPVDQLERVTGSALRARIRLIGNRQRAEAARLTALSASIEAALTMSLVTSLIFMLPSSVLRDRIEEGFEGLFLYGSMTDLGGLAFLVLVCQMAAILLLEPCYVAGGFCLYLNRRTQLEAWDLELAFRNMAARRPAPRLRSAGVAVMVIASTLLGGATLAQEPAAGAGPILEEERGQAAPAYPVTVCLTEGCRKANHEIAEVLSDPVFGSTRKLARWRFRSEPSEPGQPWVLGAGALLGRAIEPVLWASVLIGLVAFVVMRRRHDELSSLELEAAAEVLGLDVRPASLPQDIPRAARRLLHSGQEAEAISLLLRGALAELAATDRLPLRKGMTEAECAAMARSHASPARADLFGELASAWTLAAYGHRLPGPARIEDLADRWDLHFRSAS